MRIGSWIDDEGLSLDELVAAANRVVRDGFDGVWMGERLGWDPLAALGLIGREVPDVRLGTGIVRSYPRHPLALASQALTTQAASGNRLTLGIGTSHQPLIEGQYGYSFDKPARHMREYLEVLLPLLRGESVSYEGATVKAVGAVTLPGVQAPEVLLAAHRPAMLRLAGELADGVLTTWVGPRVLDEHIVPSVTKAAAGRKPPRVLATVLLSVTSEPAAKRGWVVERFGMAGSMPSYRDTLDREGVAGPEDTVILGDEATVAAAVRRLADAGLTDLLAVPLGDDEEIRRTVELLMSLR